MEIIEQTKKKKKKKHCRHHENILSMKENVHLHNLLCCNYKLSLANMAKIHIIAGYNNLQLKIQWLYVCMQLNDDYFATMMQFSWNPTTWNVISEILRIAYTLQNAQNCAHRISVFSCIFNLHSNYSICYVIKIFLKIYYRNWLHFHSYDWRWNGIFGILMRTFEDIKMGKQIE